MRAVCSGWEAAWRQKEKTMRSRYLNVVLGLGPVVFGLVVGWLIPIGQGSAILFGGVMGIMVGYLLVYSRPGKQVQLWISSSTQSKEQHPTFDLDQHVIDVNTQSAREAHILDEQRLNQIFRK